MYYTIKDVMVTRSTFARWNGENDSIHITGNRLIQNFLKYGEDAELNSPTVKQIATYDKTLLNNMLADGLQFVYQSHAIQMKRKSAKSIEVLVINLKTKKERPITLSQATLKDLAIDRTMNHDVLDVLQALYEKI